ESAAKHGRTVDRRDWRVVMSWHIAETRAQAREQAKHGLLRWHNEYTVGTLMRPGAAPFASADEAVEQIGAAGGASVIGTPDDLVAAIRAMLELTGGVGSVIGFAHDWANREDTLRSWELVARYVIPDVNGMLDAYRASQKHVIEHRAVFERAGQAVMSKIMENERAAQALAETMAGNAAMHSPNAPDLRSKP